MDQHKQQFTPVVEPPTFALTRVARLSHADKSKATVQIWGRAIERVLDCAIWWWKKGRPGREEPGRPHFPPGHARPKGKTRTPSCPRRARTWRVVSCTGSGG